MRIVKHCGKIYIKQYSKYDFIANMETSVNNKLSFAPSLALDNFSTKHPLRIIVFLSLLSLLHPFTTLVSVSHFSLAISIILMFSPFSMTAMFYRKSPTCFYFSGSFDRIFAHIYSFILNEKELLVKIAHYGQITIDLRI